MIEQINIALEQKWSGNSLPGHWSSPSETNVSKESIGHINQKWWRMNIPRSSEQDDIVNSLNYEGIAVIELQFYHSDSDQTACWLCHRLNSLND